MKGMARRVLLVPDRGLQTRMVATAVLTPAAVIAAVVAIAVLLPPKVLGGVALAAVFGLLAARKARRRDDPARVLGPDEAPKLHGLVERLCVRADIAKPDIVLEDVPQPNSWILDLPGRRPRLHLTRGLVDALEPGELEAVIAHELCHVAHGDATVMTVVGLPGAALKEGASGVRGIWFLMAGALAAWVVGTLASLGTSSLARSRELAADAGAAELTGRPSALASALMKLSATAPRLPQEDLRLAATRNAFNLLPAQVRKADRDWRDDIAAAPFVRRLTATHPPVERRIAALRAAEERLQRG